MEHEVESGEGQKENDECKARFAGLECPSLGLFTNKLLKSRYYLRKALTCVTYHHHVPCHRECCSGLLRLMLRPGRNTTYLFQPLFCR